jgi:predicted small metal-binding protein
MTKLVCSDYGFECGYQIEGDDKEVLEKFGKHSAQTHGIEYSSGALMQVLRRKTHQESSNLGITLTKNEIQAIITILDFVYSVHPMSVFEEGLKIDHRLIQQLILKISNGIE